MAADSFKTTSGQQAWDVASNWTGGVPGAGDDASIIGPTSGAYQVTISDTDPAYTVQSLTFVGQGAGTEALLVNGGLTVTGNTSFNQGQLFVREAALVSLQGVTTLSSTSSTFAQIQVGSGLPSQTATLQIATLSGSGSDSLTVFPGGLAYVGVAQGTTAFAVQNATLSVGTTSGTDSFTLYGGTLALGTTATTLRDTLIPTTQTNVDLTKIAYQTGEIASVALASIQGSNYFYTVTLNSLLGQALFTFNNVEVSGSALPIATVAYDGSSGTTVSIACFTPETRIGTPGGETAVCALRIGDLVVTSSGKAKPITWIGRRSYEGRFLESKSHLLPILFRAGCLGGGLPRRDLRVSPQHAMFLKGVLVPARLLVNGATVVQDRDCKRIDYVHVELDQHTVILAEGAPTESFIDDNSRGMFHNAMEFAALYPNRRRIPARYCAARIEDGETLASIKHEIDTRAGLSMPGLGGTLRGHVDGWQGTTLHGWAQDSGNPELPVCLEVRVAGVRVSRIIADRFRHDLLAAELGSGCHGFRVKLPAGSSRQRIEICRAADGAILATIEPMQPRRAKAA